MTKSLRDKVFAPFSVYSITILSQKQQEDIALALGILLTIAVAIYCAVTTEDDEPEA